ncbi:AMP-binding enzyme, partial [Falsiroseomonas oryzae]|uniref:AMP-binding enzyme n=1 Tax=Falsiroseomonas oryzae TaxID=2766473 RepID=UPI0022EB1315
LEEIEDRLRRAPGVAAAAVLADRDAPGGPRLHAAVAAAPDAPPDLEQALRRDLRAALPAYMQPTRLLVLPELPRLPGGKVDGVALLAQFRALPPPDGGPVDPQVARAWRSVLGRTAETSLSFREAGGDSLGFLRLALETERLTGHAGVFEALHPDMTAAEMSAALRAGQVRRGGVRVFFLPGMGGDTETHARLRDGCPGIDFVVARYLSWRDFARAGARPEADAEAVLPQALAAFDQGQPRILLGYSYGGAIGHLLARHMAAAGRPVQALLVLDNPLAVGTEESGAAPPAGAAEPPAAMLRRWLRWQRRKLGA